MTKENQASHQPSPVSATPTTVAEQIWAEIKDKEILMFALPGQKIVDYCAPVPIDPMRCFLLSKASATLPALEEAVGKEYECTSAEKYIIVSRKPKSAF